MFNRVVLTIVYFVVGVTVSGGLFAYQFLRDTRIAAFVLVIVVLAVLWGLVLDPLSRRLEAMM